MQQLLTGLSNSSSLKLSILSMNQDSLKFSPSEPYKACPFLCLLKQATLQVQCFLLSAHALKSLLVLFLMLLLSLVLQF